MSPDVGNLIYSISANALPTLVNLHDAPSLKPLTENGLYF